MRRGDRCDATLAISRLRRSWRPRFWNAWGRSASAGRASSSRPAVRATSSPALLAQRPRPREIQAIEIQRGHCARPQISVTARRTCIRRARADPPGRLLRSGSRKTDLAARRATAGRRQPSLGYQRRTGAIPGSTVRPPKRRIDGTGRSGGTYRRLRISTWPRPSGSN